MAGAAGRWLAVSALLGLAAALSPPPSGDTRRGDAVRSGLHFIYATSLIPANFAEYGDNYLWCFAGIAATSSDPALRVLAQRMGQERARRWRMEHRCMPDRPSAATIMRLVSGSCAADQLGVSDPHLKADLIRAAPRHRPQAYFDFDPITEPPPTFQLFTDALVTAYIGDTYGVPYGAHLQDVARWLPRLRPYAKQQWSELAYTITHLVYTLNGYSRYRLKPEWLPEEFAFLRTHLASAIEADDPETAGEFMDALQSFGLTPRDPLIRAGTRFLLARQNQDGSWGDCSARDAYTRYHPTWTAIDALRDYQWHGEAVTSLEALRAAVQ